MGFANRTVCTLSAVKWSVVAVLCTLGAGELLQKHWRLVVSFDPWSCTTMTGCDLGNYALLPIERKGHVAAGLGLCQEGNFLSRTIRVKD